MACGPQCGQQPLGLGHHPSRTSGAKSNVSSLWIGGLCTTECTSLSTPTSKSLSLCPAPYACSWQWEEINSVQTSNKEDSRAQTATRSAQKQREHHNQQHIGVSDNNKEGMAASAAPKPPNSALGPNDTKKNAKTPRETRRGQKGAPRRAPQPRKGARRALGPGQQQAAHPKPQTA